MKEIKVYVDELPEDCTDCPCYDFDIGGCQCKDPHFTYESINRFKGCPLIDIKVHDREVVKEVCEKIRKRYNLENKPITDAFGDTQYGYVMVSAKDLKQFLDEMEKEFEK